MDTGLLERSDLLYKGIFSVSRLMLKGPIILLAGVIVTFAREVVLAYYYGVSSELDAFRVAMTVPNVFAQSLGPVFLAALTPLFIYGSKKERRKLCGDLNFFTLFMGGALILASVVFGQSVGGVLAPGFSEEALASLAGQLVMLSVATTIILITLSFRLALVSLEIYSPGNLVNLFISAGVIFSVVLFESGLVRGIEGATVISLGVFIGALMILANHVWLAHRERWAVACSSLNINLKKWFKTGFAYTVGAVFFYQMANALPRIIDRGLASHLGEGYVSALEYSYGLITSVGMVLGTGAASVLLAKFAIRKRSLPKAETLFLVTVGALSVVVSIGLNVYGDSIVSALLGRGEFDRRAVDMTSTVLFWQALGVPFLVGSLVISAYFLSIRLYAPLVVFALAKVIARLGVLIDPSLFSLSGLGVIFAASELVGFLVLLFSGLLLARRNKFV